jgi:hypothetical protein
MNAWPRIISEQNCQFGSRVGRKRAFRRLLSHSTRLIETRLIETRLIETRLIETRLIETRLIETRLIETRLIETRLFAYCSVSGNTVGINVRLLR